MKRNLFKTKNLLNMFIFIFTLGLIFNYSCKKEEDENLLVPSITSVTPEEGTIGTELTITGANFGSGAAVMVGNKVSAEVEVSSGTIIYAKVPSGIEANTLLSVKVINAGGAEAVLNNAFMAVDPVISYINSATKPSGNAGSTVIIEGKAFGDLQGSGKVFFSGGEGFVEANIQNEDDWTDTFIVTTVPNDADDGPVYVLTEIGESNFVDFIVTEAAVFSPSTINWTITTPLPVGVSGHQTLSLQIEDESNNIQQYAVVMGGKDNVGQVENSVYVGLINNNGTVNSWSNASNLSIGRSFHASFAATPFNSKVSGNGFVYVLGGINNSGEAMSTVSMASVNEDGTLSGWSNTQALPQPLHSLGAVIFRSTVYVVGGAKGDNSPVNIVYKAEIYEDGHVGEWVEQPEIPMALSAHGLVSFGGYLYVVGGETGNINIDDDNNTTATGKVYYSKISLRTGELDEWLVNPNDLGKERSKHTTLVLGGNLFVSSGLYSGLSGNVPGSSENVYAAINADGTIGTFAGATGSNTLFSAGGFNLFNQSGISYIDADGIAHVMILGGAIVGSPESKSDNVLFY